MFKRKCKDMELRKQLEDACIIYGSNACEVKPRIKSIAQGESDAIEKANRRISELEAKLEAALELLNIKHEPAHNEPAKLVKGNKSAAIAGVLNNGWTDITWSEQDADVIKRRREQAHAIYNRTLFNMAAGMNTCVRDGD